MGEQFRQLGSRGVVNIEWLTSVAGAAAIALVGATIVRDQARVAVVGGESAATNAVLPRAQEEPPLADPFGPVDVFWGAALWVQGFTYGFAIQTWENLDLLGQLELGVALGVRITDDAGLVWQGAKEGRGMSASAGVAGRALRDAGSTVDLIVSSLYETAVVGLQTLERAAHDGDWYQVGETLGRGVSNAGLIGRSRRPPVRRAARSFPDWAHTIEARAHGRWPELFNEQLKIYPHVGLATEHTNALVYFARHGVQEQLLDRVADTMLSLRQMRELKEHHTSILRAYGTELRKSREFPSAPTSEQLLMPVPGTFMRGGDLDLTIGTPQHARYVRDVGSLLEKEFHRAVAYATHRDEPRQEALRTAYRTAEGRYQAAIRQVAESALALTARAQHIEVVRFAAEKMQLGEVPPLVTRVTEHRRVAAAQSAAKASTPGWRSPTLVEDRVTLREFSGHGWTLQRQPNEPVREATRALEWLRHAEGTKGYPQVVETQLGRSVQFFFHLPGRTSDQARYGMWYQIIAGRADVHFIDLDDAVPYPIVVPRPTHPPVELPDLLRTEPSISAARDVLMEAAQHTLPVLR